MVVDPDRDWEPPASMLLLRKEQSWDVLELVPHLVSGFDGSRPRLSATLAFSLRKRPENHSDVSSITLGVQPNEGVWVEWE